MKKIKVLELFAGSRSIGNTAEELGMQVFSVDWTPYEKIDLAIDIEELKKEQVPFIPDVVWASPDCTTFCGFVSVCPLHKVSSLPQILMGQIAQNRCYRQ